MSLQVSEEVTRELMTALEELQTVAYDAALNGLHPNLISLRARLLAACEAARIAAVHADPFPIVPEESRGHVAGCWKYANPRNPCSLPTWCKYVDTGKP